MTKFDSNMERDINRCAVALEKILKRLNEHDGQFSDIRNMLGCVAELNARQTDIIEFQIFKDESEEAKDKAKQAAKARRRTKK